jgi:hypothetical protein
MKFREFVSLNEGELTQEMRELELYIDNDHQLYKQMYIPQLKNLTKKMRKGIYDRKLAAKLFMYLLDAGAKKYFKEFGSPGNKPSTMFPKKDREKLAMRYAMQFEIDYKDQEYDFMKEDIDEACGKAHEMKDDDRRYLSKAQAEKLPEKVKREIIKKKKKKNDDEELTEAARPLWQIAQEIKRDWKNVNFAAKPYLEAMGQLDKITDKYMYDSAVSVVLYFLSNASSWKGDKAKKIKAELKAMTKK